MLAHKWHKTTQFCNRFLQKYDNQRLGKFSLSTRWNGPFFFPRTLIFDDFHHFQYVHGAFLIPLCLLSILDFLNNIDIAVTNIPETIYENDIFMVFAAGKYLFEYRWYSATNE